MSLFTCLACRVAFHSPDLQRAHYKTKWHQYNLRRKVAQLPPITREQFETKALAREAEESAALASNAKYCNVCRKEFLTEKSYESHIRSKRHLSSAKQQDEKTAKLSREITGEKDYRGRGEDDADDDSDSSWEDIGNEEPFLADLDCLFCPLSSETLELNLAHMSREHGFLIPDLDFVCDVDALVSRLDEIVGADFTCLFCARQFRSLSAAQQHMVDKCHCKIPYDTLDDALRFADFYDYNSSAEDQAVQDDATATASSSLPLVLVENASPSEFTDDGYEMILPSGAIIGHRSLMRYYRQNLRSPVAPERSVTRRSLKNVLTQYRALGWTGMSDDCAVRRAKDLGHLQRLKARQSISLQLKANSLQKHMRDPSKPVKN